MKKIICLFTALCIALTFASCRLVNKNDKHRDYEGYVQFVVEFNSGLFAYTNTDSDLAYSPSNPKLQKEFEYANSGVRFSADYEADKIVYTVVNPSEDRTDEAKAFDEIYNIYLESWNYFADKTDIGAVSSTQNNDDISSIRLIISGNSYNVTFYPYDDVPHIVYEIIAIA